VTVTVSGVNAAPVVQADIKISDGSKYMFGIGTFIYESII